MKHLEARLALLALALVSTGLYAILAQIGDLRAHPFILLGVNTLLLLVMWIGSRLLRRSDGGSEPIVLAAALLFRIVMVTSHPSLSDDVYRYVWDGRVQVHGLSPYSYAPESTAVAHLRDDDWRKINHPELPTIYPPLAEMLFCALAFLGAGPIGFKLAMGLLDFGVVLALRWLLRRMAFPRERLILYAWNPLAVIETAGSGHVEPLGVLLLILAAGFLASGRRIRSAAAFACTVLAKVLPLALLPCWWDRLRWKGIAMLALFIAAIALPYALWGPVDPAGAIGYAGSWEHNSFFFCGVRTALEKIELTPFLKAKIDLLKPRLGSDALPWDFLYRHVWPDDLARALVAVAALAWILSLSRRPWLDPGRESLLVVGGVLLLSPTFHPWYALWVLPFAAAYLSRGWILLAALLPLAYSAGSEGVGWSVRLAEYVPSFALMAFDTLRPRGRRDDRSATLPARPSSASALRRPP